MGLRDRAAAFETALLAGGFAVLFFFLPHGLKGDDWNRLNAVSQLVRHGHVTSDKYSLVQAFLAAPFERIDEAFSSLDYLIARFNIIVLALGTLAAYFLLRSRVEARLLRRVVLVVLFASFATERLRGYGAEVSTATLVVVGMLALATDRRMLGWTLMVIGVVNTPPTIVGLAVVAIVETVRGRRLRRLLPIAAAIVLVCAEAWWRRGGPFHTGYEHDQGAQTLLPYSGKPGFSYPFVLGVLSILFSFGRGLVFYAPGLLLWLSGWTRRIVPGRRTVALMFAFVAGLVVIYAKWWAWYGGGGWGPRFFFFAAFPASLFIGVRILHAGKSVLVDAVTLLALVFSAWVSFAGATADPAQMYEWCSKFDPMCWYVPDYSTLWQPFLKFPGVPTSTRVYIAYFLIVLVYLAAPLVAALARALPRLRHQRSWTHGWRF